MIRVNCGSAMVPGPGILVVMNGIVMIEDEFGRGCSGGLGRLLFGGDIGGSFTFFGSVPVGLIRGADGSISVDRRPVGS